MVAPQHSKRLAAAARRRQILGVAAELFTKQGFEAVSMADIARVLGISRPAVYSYFASTEAVLEALLEEHLGQLWQHLEAVIPARSSAAPRPAPGFYVRLFTVLLGQSGTLLLLYSGGGPVFQARRNAFLTELERRLDLQFPSAGRRPYQMSVVTHLLGSLAFFAVQQRLPDAHLLAETLDSFTRGGMAELARSEPVRKVSVT